MLEFILAYLLTWAAVLWRDMHDPSGSVIAELASELTRELLAAACEGFRRYSQKA